MVFGKPWNEAKDSYGYDFRHQSPNENYFQKLFAFIAAKGICKLPPLVIAAAGFGIGGVLPGPFAALWHSYIGNVTKDSIFACLQSAGAGGHCLKPLEDACNMLMATNVGTTQWSTREEESAWKEESAWEARSRGDRRFEGTIVCDAQGDCKRMKRSR